MTDQILEQEIITLDKQLEDIEDTYRLIVFDDNTITFNTVISAFCEILHYDSIRAEQLAWNIHNTGKAIVKTDLYKELIPFYEKLSQRELTCEIQ
jgi:ATP-dependent Clp protease adapter protein ClpS